MSSTYVMVFTILATLVATSESTFTRPVVSRVVHYYPPPARLVVARHVYHHHAPVARLVRHYAPAPLVHAPLVEELVEPVEPHPYYPEYLWRRK